MTDSRVTVAAVERTRALLEVGRLELPHPAGGATAARWRALVELARHDVATARVAEAHVDAVSILAEAGLHVGPGPGTAPALYGVWAAEEPGRRVQLVEARGRPALDGVKAFCTGAGAIDRALVTAHDDHGVALVDVDLRHTSVTHDVGEWSTPALAATSTATVTFDATPVARPVGAPGWYLDRPGFWHGACGPAACWAGGAIGLVDRAFALAGGGVDAHRAAHLGALDAAAWQLAVLLDVAGHEIDARPVDAVAARRRALRVRHLVERTAAEVIDRFGRALGPRPLIRDGDVVARIADLQLYVRQSHAERDLESLGRSRTDEAD